MKYKAHITKPVAIAININVPTNVKLPGSLPVPGVQNIETTLWNRLAKNVTKALAMFVNSSNNALINILTSLNYLFSKDV